MSPRRSLRAPSFDLGCPHERRSCRALQRTVRLELRHRLLCMHQALPAPRVREAVDEMHNSTTNSATLQDTQACKALASSSSPPKQERSGCPRASWSRTDKKSAVGMSRYRIVPKALVKMVALANRLFTVRDRSYVLLMAMTVTRSAFWTNVRL